MRWASDWEPDAQDLCGIRSRGKEEIRIKKSKQE
jgi:hypothetical protein